MSLPWFLFAKLVAGKAEDSEAVMSELFVQCIQFYKKTEKLELERHTAT